MRLAVHVCDNSLNIDSHLQGCPRNGTGVFEAAVTLSENLLVLVKTAAFDIKRHCGVAHGQPIERGDLAPDGERVA